MNTDSFESTIEGLAKEKGMSRTQVSLIMLFSECLN